MKRLITATIRDRILLPDRGSVALWVVITTPALMLLAILIVDGGARMKAGEQADTYATEAARSAVAGIGPRSADLGIDTRFAIAAANAYLASTDVSGQVSVTGRAQITVTVTITRTGPISGVHFTITRSATAQLLVGVERGEVP